VSQGFGLSSFLAEGGVGEQRAGVVVPLRAVAPWFLPPGHVARSGCTEGRGRRAKPASEREADDARIEGEQAWAAP